VSGHFAQFRQDATHVLIGVHESHYDRKFAAGFYEMSCANSAAAVEAGYGVQHHSSGDVLFAQIFENFQVQRAAVP
jgi:hypothetical protein